MDRGESPFYVGVDVGTGSARAAVFDSSGRRVGMDTNPIKTWKPAADFVEQSSSDIWQACCSAVRGALTESGVPPDAVLGIGFDATCSLVVLDKQGDPLTVSTSGEDERNVVVWMDHRAIEQADCINRTGHRVLEYVGGVISPEMESPKLLWIKENLPSTWEAAGHFFDLPDYLTYRATGRPVRSLCSTVCKWTYLGHEPSAAPGSIGRWDDTYWNAIGLSEFVDEDYERIGQVVRPPGEAIPPGLTPHSAAELGLRTGTAVGVSMIDAHAGGIGMIGANQGGDAPVNFDTRLALIGGTSSCHMAVSAEPRFIRGVWGPYFSAMMPGMWLTEGGQSATGALIDHIVWSHRISEQVEAEAKDEGRTPYDVLNAYIDRLAGDVPAAMLTKDLHVLPYFHGNRSPRADPSLRGMISGLRLSDTIEDLALLYLATIQAIAYGTRHIIQSLNKAGYAINSIFLTGGGRKNRVFLREHADATGCTVTIPRETEAVLLGAAILGATASGRFESIADAMGAMTSAGETVTPASRIRTYHDQRYMVFLKMYEDQMTYRAMTQQTI